MKKFISFLIALVLICSMSVLNVVCIEAKVELPDPVIGLTDEDINNLTTDTLENPKTDTIDNSIVPRIRRNVNSAGNVQKSVSLTPAPFKEQDKNDLHTALPKRDTLTEEVYDTGFVSSDDEFMPGEIIICFKDECSSSIISKLITKQKVVKTQDIYKSAYDSAKQSYSVNEEYMKMIKEDVGKYYVIKIASKSKEDVLKTIEELNKNSIVKYAEPNYISKPCIIPNDYNNYNLWNMNRIQMPEAWDMFQGSNIKVGVLDTGIDATHPDLKDNIDTNLGWNCIKEANTDTMDYHAHGTHVAGTIGAKGNNSIGVVGVNPNAKLVPIKICLANNNSNSTALLMAEGIRYAMENGISVCNLSYGIFNSSFLRETIKKYGEKGGIITIAAGNESVCIDNIPAYTSLVALDNIILVSNSNNSSGDNEYLHYYSNYGGIVHVAAPGTEIISTVPISEDPSGYKSNTGTSMAAPHVAGVVSLLKGKYPDMTPIEIRETIMDSATYVSNISGKVASGRLNARNAINRIPDESNLSINPNAGEKLVDAIKRSLGSRPASKIKAIKLIGMNEMSGGNSSSDSANAVLPNLEYADISEYSRNLKPYAFYGCSKLTTVILPEKNVQLPAYGFMYCTKLSTIYKANSGGRVINEADLTGLISSSTG